MMSSHHVLYDPQGRLAHEGRPISPRNRGTTHGAGPTTQGGHASPPGRSGAAPA